MFKCNYCVKCSKWMGWPRLLVFWEKKKICSSCQTKQGQEIEIF